MAHGDPLLVNLLHAMYMCSAFSIRAKDYLRSTVYDPDLVDEIILDGLIIKDLTALPDQYKRVHGTGAELVPYQHSLRPKCGPLKVEANADEMLCSTWGVHIVINRILVALRPLASNAHSLEHETLTYAYSLMDLNAQRRREGKESGGRMAELENLRHHAEFTAELAINLKDDWKHAISGDLDAFDICREVVSSDIFERWAHALAHKAPTRGAVVLSEGKK